MHQSIATIDSPEFINLQPLDINPLMSKCEIKVLYVGENRNRSFITKEVASDMAKTLRGAPIVGYFREEKEDFTDHGEQIIFDDEGVKFNCLTKPYGFVAPDAEVWFQKFEDTDEFGNKMEREYLMTTGYLWTGQYEEAKVAVEQGRPQSMELDNDTLDGHWSTDVKNGMDFFIINDAIFSKLCILGDDVEPCFEGASVTKPQVSTSFTKVDDTFKKTLYTMMQDLKFALEGGQNMDIDNEVTPVEEEVIETPETTEEETVVEDKTEETSVEENQESTESQSTEGEEAASEFKKEDKDKDDEEDSAADDKEDSDDDSDEEDDEDEKKKPSKNTLEAEYEDLKAKFTSLEENYQKLVEFKNQVENEKKDALIDSFYMLSDEDKKEVIENKSKYSLDEIEAKLSVICVRNKVSFDLDEDDKKEKSVVTYNLNDNAESSIPAWISAVKKVQNNNKEN